MSESNNSQPFFVKYMNFSIVTAVTNWVFKTIAYAMLHAVILTILWNMVIPSIFPFLKPLDYPQAVGLVLILRLLSRSWLQESRNEMLFNLLNVAQFQNNNICNIMMFLANTFGMHVPRQPTSDTPDAGFPQKLEVSEANNLAKIENFDETG